MLRLSLTLLLIIFVVENRQLLILQVTSMNTVLTLHYNVERLRVEVWQIVNHLCFRKVLILGD